MLRYYVSLMLTVLLSVAFLPVSYASETYIVKTDDSLWSISLNILGNGARWNEIAELNNLYDPRVIHSGNVLTLPSQESNSETSVSLVGGGSNLLSNHDFEANDFGLIKNWRDTGAGYGKWYLVQNDPERQYTGQIHASEITYPDRGFVLKSIDYRDCSNFCSSEAVQIVPAKENTGYVLSADGMAAEGHASLYLDFLDEYKNRISVKTTGGFGSNWSMQTVSGVSPVGTSYIRVILYSSNDNKGVLYWDNIVLQEAQ